MEVVKIVGIGIILSIVLVLIKQIKPELATVVLVAGSVIMLTIILKYFANVMSVFDVIINKTGINKDLFAIVLKIVGVGYLIEFGANVCVDSGNNAIADKVLLGGKLIILILAMPIITSLLDVVIGLIPWYSAKKRKAN